MAGNIATEYVAKSKPDGYTIFIAPASSILVAGPFLYKKLNYDPIKDFTSVTTLASCRSSWWSRPTPASDRWPNWWRG
jgi:tripartite-type tricarboxylate transporter receptor subunit TctC